ncbi:hypothetical protein OSTOST_05468, partial [Ostertagia ostertagi]
STRGASKQRRDQINVEIQRLRDLLPLSESIKDRLFQLPILRTIAENSVPLPKGLDSCKALRGFLIMLNRSGKLLHVSDNASEYLGHSIEEIMCQGDSIFDLVDSRDHPTIHNELNSGPQPTTSFPEERVFLCRLNLARTAKLHSPSRTIYSSSGIFQAIANTPEATQPIFAAYCQPVINPENAETLSMGNTDVFSSQHFLDMTFKEVDHMCAHHLGYHREELRGQICQEKEGSVLALIKMRSSDGEWLWMHTVFAVRGNLCHEVQEGRRVRHVIHCYYQSLSGIEAAALQANAWIYNIRHTYPAAFPCQGSPTPASSLFLLLNGNRSLAKIRADRSLSPISPFPAESSFPQSIDQLVPFIKQEPFTQMTMIPAYGNCAQIKVEIPMKTMPHISMFTPESSSPESSASLTSALFAQPFFSGPGGSNESAMAMEDFNCILPLTLKGTLPDLRDGLDDFFREVEQPAENARASTAAPITSATASSYSPEQATDLFKYLGPALFGGPSAQTMESLRVTNSLPNGVHCARKRSWVV